MPGPTYTIRLFPDHTTTLEERPVFSVDPDSSADQVRVPTVAPPVARPGAPEGDGMAALPVPPFEPLSPNEAPPLSASLDPARLDPATGAMYIPLLLPLDAPVRLAVYTSDGREAAVLVDAELPAGRHHVRFEADGLAPGAYICEMQTQGYFATRKLTLHG